MFQNYVEKSTRKVLRALESAVSELARHNQNVLTPEAILIGLLDEPDTEARRIIELVSEDPHTLIANLIDGVRGSLQQGQQASVNQIMPQKREFMVGITVEGELRYEGKNINLPELRREMRTVHTSSPETMVLIQADRQSRHGRVVEVMDLAKRIGFERIGIAIETARQDNDEQR